MGTGDRGQGPPVQYFSGPFSLSSLILSRPLLAKLNELDERGGKWRSLYFTLFVHWTYGIMEIMVILEISENFGLMRSLWDGDAVYDDDDEGECFELG